eukprot:2411750-Prymnesium_polylepis.2
MACVAMQCVRARTQPNVHDRLPHLGPRTSTCKKRADRGTTKPDRQVPFGVAHASPRARDRPRTHAGVRCIPGQEGS